MTVEDQLVAQEGLGLVVGRCLGRIDQHKSWKGRLVAEAARSYGGKVFATVTNASHAKKALSAGADALIVTGHEAAAHGGGVGSAVLIPALVS